MRRDGAWTPRQDVKAMWAFLLTTLLVVAGPGDGPGLGGLAPDAPWMLSEAQVRLVVAAADADGDGALSQDELGIGDNPSLRATLDTNRDGRMARAEVEAGLRAGRFTLRVHGAAAQAVAKALDARGDGDLGADDLKPSYDVLRWIDREPFGRVSVAELTSGLDQGLVGIARYGVVAQIPPPPTELRPPSGKAHPLSDAALNAFVIAADVDGDGTLSGATELTLDAASQTLLDADKDGRITRAEVVAQLKADRFFMTPTGLHAAAALTSLDRNRDGYLLRDELRLTYEVMRLADRGRAVGPAAEHVYTAKVAGQPVVLGQLKQDGRVAIIEMAQDFEAGRLVVGRWILMAPSR